MTIYIDNLYYAQGQYDKAEPLYQRKLAILEKIGGPGHPRGKKSWNFEALQTRKAGTSPVLRACQDTRWGAILTASSFSTFFCLGIEADLMSSTQHVKNIPSRKSGVLPRDEGKGIWLGQLLIDYKINALAANPDWFAEAL